MLIRSKIPLVLFLFGIIIFFSLYRLTESPGVWYDEGIYIETAKNLAQTGNAGMRLSPDKISSVFYVTVGYPLIYPLSLIFSFFGSSVLSARLLMVFFIFSLAVISYFLIKRRYGPEKAIMSLALLATLPTLYGNGKSVLGEVPGLFWLLSFLWFFGGRMKDHSNRKIYIILAGLSAGLCVSTKPFFLLLIPSIIIVAILKRRHWFIDPRETLLAIIAFLLPVLFWAFTQFRADDPLTDLFVFYANPYRLNNIFVVIIGNARHFATSIGPLYLLLMISVWIASVAIRFKKRVNISAEEMIAFTFSLLATAAFLRTAGLFRYLFPAQVVSLLYFPSSLFFITQSLRDKFPRIKFASKRFVPYAIIIILSSFGLYQTMFSSWVASAYSSRKTAFWEKYFENQPASQSLFFYDTPEVAIFAKHNNYYQYMSPVGVEFGPEQLSIVEFGIPQKIFIKTSTFKNFASSTRFSHYSIDEEVYKYTILKKTLR